MKAGPGFGNVLNAVQFQLGWIVCVWMQGVEAIVFVALALAVHFWVVRNRLQDCLLVLLVPVIGWGLESIALALQLYSIAWDSKQWLIGGVPHWLLLLWVLFSLTLNHSMSWLKRNILLSGLLGLLIAPLSYVAGERLGVVSLESGAFLHLGGLWCIVLIMLVFWQRSVPPKVSAMISHTGDG